MRRSCRRALPRSQKVRRLVPGTEDEGRVPNLDGRDGADGACPTDILDLSILFRRSGTRFVSREYFSG